MRTIAASDLQNQPQLHEEITDILREGGLVIFPGNSNYRIGADVLNPGAVNKLLQSKRRVQDAPALVFVADKEMLFGLVRDIPRVADELINAFWPGPLTIRLQPGEEWPKKIRKSLSKKTGSIGFRIPADDLSRKVVEDFGGPLLVSSANRSKRHGAHSVAQVRRFFGQVADLLIDAGDLSPGKSSTVVDVQKGSWQMVRESAVSEEEIAAITSQ